jgi:hypothetical protein
MCEGVCLQNEGIQEAVCEDRVRQVERLMMMRGTALNAKRMQFDWPAGRLAPNSQCGRAITDGRGLR